MAKLYCSKCNKQITMINTLLEHWEFVHKLRLEESCQVHAPED